MGHHNLRSSIIAKRNRRLSRGTTVRSPTLPPQILCLPCCCRSERTNESVGLCHSRRWFPCEHLVKNRAERKHVAAWIGWLALRLLRRHVCHRPDDHRSEEHTSELQS